MRTRYMFRLVLLLAMGLAGGVAGQRSAAAEVVAVAAGRLSVQFDRESGELAVRDSELGTLLETGAIQITAGGKSFCTGRETTARVQTANEQQSLVFELGQSIVARLTLAGENTLEITTSEQAGALAGFVAWVPAQRAMIPVLLAHEQPRDQGVLITRLGSAEVPGVRALFDRRHDAALSADSAGKVGWSYGEHGRAGIALGAKAAPGGAGPQSATLERRKQWNLSAEAPAGGLLLQLAVHRHYIRDELKVGYFAPIETPPRWPTAPVVAMTWYGIEGWKNRPAQRHQWLFPNIDWVAEHLKPYAGDNLVFQLDDSYRFDDDQYMRELSDYIRSKGLVPGIWFTPFGVASQQVAEAHPDWFLHDANGKLLAAFGGVNWGWGGQFGSRAGVLNATSAQAVEQQLAMFWRKTSETWNFDFFKIDGQPQVIEQYLKAADGDGVAGYHRGLQVARQIVGPEKFINGCWGTPLAAIGHVNGSRTGPDTGNHPHAIDVILRWNFLNNVCWWCDPDAAANLYRATVERARLNAQARVLTGQQFLTDDVWVDVPPAICRTWQLSFPTLDIRPVNLYPIEDWHRYDVFDLRIGAAWGTWDVVGLFNYDNRAAAKQLDLARLPLEADQVHVFEFWKQQYVGRFARSAKITRWLVPYEGEVFAVVPAVADRPVLISTTRHVTQGAADIEQLQWQRQNGGFLFRGRSQRLVAGDPYRLVFAGGPYRIAKVQATVPIRAERSGSLETVVLTPDQSGTIAWEVTFAKQTEPWLGVFPSSLVMELAATGEPGPQPVSLVLESRASQPVEYRIRCEEPGVAISPGEGRLDPWPAVQTVTISASQMDLQPGETRMATVVVEQPNGRQPAIKVPLLLVAPPPTNLAAQARAAASSVWSADYEPARAIDSNEATRWNSAPSNVNGCWLELVWPEPVRFNQVEIDECVDWGQRIESWRLEAGDEQLSEIAQGTRVGRHFLVKLDREIQARRLRLTVLRASVTPTIWELKVHHVPEPK